MYIDYLGERRSLIRMPKYMLQVTYVPNSAIPLACSYSLS